MRRLLFTVMVLVIAFSPGLAWQGKGKGKGHNKAAEARFSPREVQIIEQYFAPGTGNLPPGLAKRGGDLPPGLQKQLQRNGQLPPGLQKRLAPFPPALAERLPPPPPGCRRALAGTWALLINDATNVVLDVLELTRRPR